MSEGIIGNRTYVIDIKVINIGIEAAEKETMKLTDLVKKLNVVGNAISIGKKAIAAADEYSNAMTTIQQATGATNEQMKATEVVANNLYKDNFGKSWEDLGSAISTTMQITKQTGIDLQNTTKNALLLKDAFGYSVTESVKTADTMMQTFGVTSEQSMGLLAQGAQSGLDRSGKLVETANQYSKPFQELGFTANEMFDTLAAGSNNGALSLDTVGAAIGQFSTLSTNGSDATRKAFESLGLNADQMISTFTAGGPKAKESFSGIMQMLSKIEDPVKRNSIGVALMGDQFKSLDAPIIAAMGTARSQFDMTKDTMEKMNNTNFDSPGEALETIGRQIETGFLIPLGLLLVPLLEFASEVVGFFIDHLDVLVPALGAVALVLMVAMAPAMWASAVAGWAMIAPLLPIIGLALLIGAAMAGVILIFKNWGTIGPWLSAIWTTFVAFTMSIFSSIITFFVTWGLAIWGAITGSISWIVTLVSTYWNQIWLSTTVVFTAIWTTITTIWTTIVTSVTTFVTNIFNTISGIWDQISTISSNLWTNISEGIVGMWEGIKGGFVTGINWIIGKINSMIEKINSALSIDLPDWLGGPLNINIPTIPTIPKGSASTGAITGGVGGPAVDGRHALGLANVPFDGYIAELHKGERVMTAAENKAYSSSDPARNFPARVASSNGGVSINVTVPVTVEGGSGTLPSAQNMGVVVAQEVQKILESVLRRNGLGAMG
ncbi:phage tail tape measure protein [Paenibacillus macquariensis]|uniref:Phage-related minor tail protein n=1 Tax=Paenibacillus macquariensis TaxID=948756 RepID=A0ABY1JSE0_9BACL|nr:phage tail tape measure protein [Paenibacillus macquariensis]MEC0092915.1 phage tail tape measure protein [Paenibacillus macquariensis]OAB36282.1 hypothetical protein PMSM_07495 [Paenibacillus macquariensis subsp. macquariensis]SIQ68672.1 Phage-related minor tail protein [Paenibacillus macquariensis]